MTGSTGSVDLLPGAAAAVVSFTLAFNLFSIALASLLAFLASFLDNFLESYGLFD
jgi:hypothetical protein